MTKRFVTHKDHIEGSPTINRWILLDKEGTQKNGPQGYDYYLIDGHRISGSWDPIYKVVQTLNERNDQERLPEGGLTTQTEETPTEETPTEETTETKTEETPTPEETKTEETTEETPTEETPTEETKKGRTRKTPQTTH